MPFQKHAPLNSESLKNKKQAPNYFGASNNSIRNSGSMKSNNIS